MREADGKPRRFFYGWVVVSVSGLVFAMVRGINESFGVFLVAFVEEFAELSVSDRGPGIPEDKLKEFFKPFFTTKPEGMGMGLSIARTIVEAHHGLISAQNRDHDGASFRIRLPLVR